MQESRIKNWIGGTIILICLYLLFFTEYGFEEIHHNKKVASNEMYFHPPELSANDIPQHPQDAVDPQLSENAYEPIIDEQDTQHEHKSDSWLEDEEFMKNMPQIPINLHRADFEEELYIMDETWKRVSHKHFKGPRDFIHDEKWELEHKITVEKVAVKPKPKPKPASPNQPGNNVKPHPTKPSENEVSARGWQKYSQHKQGIAMPANASHSIRHGVGIDTETVELLAQLEQEVARLRGQLNQINDEHQGGVNDAVLSAKSDTNVQTGDGEEEEEEDGPLITVLNVEDGSVVSKSMDTLTKFVGNTPAPVFLKQFNNPCFIEQINEETTKQKYIKKVMRSCERLRSSYPKFEKAKQVVSDVPVQVFTQSGILDGDFRLRCIPYFYLLGFPKCGTTDLRSRLMLHNYIKDAVCKEPQFWDRRRFQKEVTYADYLDLFNLGTQRILNTEVNGYNPMILGDFSTRTIGNEYYWELYEGNTGLPEPSVLSAHEIHHLNPNTKFIVSMRNPTERLYSDYMHFSHVSSEDFHSHVVASIEWWRACVKAHPLRRCLYGQPADMPPLDPPGNYWSTEATAQIRTGFYYHFIVDWLEVFKKEQFLFVEFKEYVVDEAGYITDVILPFLNMGPLSDQKEKAAGRTTKLNARNTHSGKAKMDMLPETRQLLDHFYSPFNNKLAELLGDDKYKWHIRDN